MVPFTSKKGKLDLGIRRSRVRLPPTEATQEKLRRDEAAKKWGHAWLDEIFKEWQASKRQSTSNTEVFDNIEPNFHDREPEEEHLFLGQETNDPDIPGSFTKYISGDRYKSRRIQEHQEWKGIMQEIFIAFMQCSDQTSQWGNQANWNHNFQADLSTCICNSASKTFRDIDAVDLTSEFLETSFALHLGSSDH